MVEKQAHVLLIEDQPNLRDLENAILSMAGYRVGRVPSDTDPVDYAASTHPDVIVLNVRLRRTSVEIVTEPAGWGLVDGLRVNPATRGMPVVLLSTMERAVAEGRYAPNVRRCLSAPYDIDALIAAVSAALLAPPPAAFLPASQAAPAKGIEVASDLLVRNAWLIVAQAFRQLSAVEPYRSAPAELRHACIACDPTLAGAVYNCLGRGLLPTDVFAIPAIRRYVHHHTAVHMKEGLGSMTVIFEYQLLRRGSEHVLEEQGRHAELVMPGFEDAAKTVDRFFDDLNQLVSQEFLFDDRIQRAA